MAVRLEPSVRLTQADGASIGWRGGGSSTITEVTSKLSLLPAFVGSNAFWSILASMASPWSGSNSYDQPCLTSPGLDFRFWYTRNFPVQLIWQRTLWRVQTGAVIQPTFNRGPTKRNWLRSG